MSIISAAVLSICLTGCGSEEAKTAADNAVKVKVCEIAATSASEQGNYSGTVEEKNGTDLSFATMGTISQIRVKVGDRVAKGQLIATVDPTSSKNAYAAAQAARTQAEDAYQRMKQLHDKGSLAEIKWIEVQSQVKEAVSAEQIAKKSLADCNLVAPYSGIISEKVAEVGQNVMPGMPVVKLVTASQLDVKISVPESEIASVKIGDRASIKVQALGGRSYTGTVREKGVVANAISRSYDVKIHVNGADAQLLPGMVTEVALVKEDSAQAIVIPSNIVQLADNNRNFVWVAKGDKAERRYINVGEYTASGVVVASGLSAGDKVIVEGQQKVCNGSEIKY